ncbi:DUF1275 domain-containing protein [Pseudonocardiaceae bacterium YIM PH 21723]|nr:DUF1275 domain-containing protein [Pseudonocardiaceae bacterium YIM PH 21723]
MRDAWRTIVPDLDGADGPLPPLLLALTFVTGLVDSVSFLQLGHVFVANMTGNIVFVAFALAGTRDFDLWASIIALGAFVLGAMLAGRIGFAVRHRGRHLLLVVAAETVLVLATCAFTWHYGIPEAGWERDLVILLLGIAMGAQSATARQLAVADLNTTVLTQTLAGMSADSALAGGSGGHAGRRLLAVLTMILGAFTGAALVLHAHTVSTLVLATALLAVTALVTGSTARTNRRWTIPK